MIVTLTLLLTAYVAISPVTCTILSANTKQNLAQSDSVTLAKRASRSAFNHCEENTEPYPTETGMSCRCKKGFLQLSPVDHKCYRQFTQGPCPERHFIYLPLNETVTTCVKNPCGHIEEYPPLFPDNKHGCFKIYDLVKGCRGNTLLSVDPETRKFECTGWPVKNADAIDALKVGLEIPQTSG